MGDATPANRWSDKAEVLPQFKVQEGPPQFETDFELWSAELAETVAQLTPAQKVREWCLAHLGREYVWAGEGPGYDCSGVAKCAWWWATNGQVRLTHLARAQYGETDRVFDPHDNIGLLRCGDLVFYERSDVTGGYGHVAVFMGWYAGHRWVMQATDFGVLSEVIPIDFYTRHQAYGRPRHPGSHAPSKYHALFDGRGINRTKFASYL